MIGQRQNICFSGGAEGADSLFGKLAADAGHHVIHYSFDGMKADESVPMETLHPLSTEQLQQSKAHIIRASQMIKRNPPRKGYVKKLIHMSFFQVRDAEAVYAVTRWNLANDGSMKTMEGQLGGGTGWAVAMAMESKVPHIFLYAIEKQRWYQYVYDNQDRSNDSSCINSWHRLPNGFVPPKPTGRYAGIGSRDLGEDGERAILALFFADGQNSDNEHKSRTEDPTRSVVGMPAQPPAAQKKTRSTLKREKDKKKKAALQQEAEQQKAAAQTPTTSMDPEKRARKIKKNFETNRSAPRKAHQFSRYGSAGQAGNGAGIESRVEANGSYK